MARRHFPRRYSRELPRLVGGRSAGLPRVYDIVLGLVAHVDAQLEEEGIASYLSAYQVVTPLKLGELWAVPIMLRLALIENLRRITDRLTVDRRNRDLADEWAARLEKTAEAQPSKIVVVVADMARADLPITSAFVAEFYQRLSRSTASIPLARNWLEQRLSENSLSIEQLVRTESQSQAADQVSINHTITGLRMISAWDWRGFVEEASIVERILRTDPADVYRLMDFTTRDRYRHVIEAIGRYADLPEADIAERCVRLAEAAAQANGRDDRKAHVGYFLIGAGRPQLESGTGARWPAAVRIKRAVRRFPIAFYLGNITSITLAGTLAALYEGHRVGVSEDVLLAFCPVLALSFSQLAIGVVNWLSAILTGPAILPRLDYTGGVPPESSTMVVVPTLVPNLDAVAGLMESLEIHFLANRDSNVHFALLSDFPDADSETLPEDAELRKSLREGVIALNGKYGAKKEEIFYLFHRPRRWNASEGRWMAFERKRGKIAEFNALLRGSNADSFNEVVGDLSILPRIRYVITLDTDTQLPRNAAQRLAATMAHPLNRPQYDASRGIVVDGYSILQPRVSISLPGARRSLFARLFSGDVGIDPYTREAFRGRLPGRIRGGFVCRQGHLRCRRIRTGSGRQVSRQHHPQP